METLACAIPILPGKTEECRSFLAEVKRARRNEFEDAQRRLGIEKENWYLQQTPQGDLLVIYCEATDLVKVFQKLADSKKPFDLWFKEKALSLHGVDMSQPMTELPAETLFEWQNPFVRV